MTLCIAAFSTVGWDENKNPLTNIVLCSDMRIETPVAGSETANKMQKIGQNWAAMIAGNVSRAHELLSIYCADLPHDPIPETQILDTLRVPPQKLKRRLAEEYVQATVAMPYDQFIASGKESLPTWLFDNMMTEISRMEIGCQVLLIPTNKQTIRQFYCVELDGSVFQQEHFCAIGSGQHSASSWLHYRQHASHHELEQTLCSVLEAKKFSENAPGVGRRTNLSILTDDGRILFLHDETMPEKVWKRTGPRKNDNIKFTLPKMFYSVKWDDLDVG
jgi:20S proteasome alpha/beta subunit